MNDWCPKCGKRHAQTTAGCPQTEHINLRDLTPEKMEELFGPPGEFKPHWHYNKAGDQIEVVWKNVPVQGEYINADVYLLKDMDTGEVVGVTAPSVLLRLEKEGVVCSVGTLAAVRTKLAEMREGWEGAIESCPEDCRSCNIECPHVIAPDRTVKQLRELEALLGEKK